MFVQTQFTRIGLVSESFFFIPCIDITGLNFNLKNKIQTFGFQIAISCLLPFTCFSKGTKDEQ